MTYVIIALTFSPSGSILTLKATLRVHIFCVSLVGDFSCFDE